MKSETGSAETLRGFCSQSKISQGKQVQEIFFSFNQLNEISKDKSHQRMLHSGLFYCTDRMGGLQNRLTTLEGWLCQHFPLKPFTDCVCKS